MNTASPSSSDAHAPFAKTLVDTLVGLGSSWAAYGLKVGKMALVQSAETLGKTAETLDTLAAVMEKKAAEAKSVEPSAEASKDEPAPPTAGTKSPADSDSPAA